MTSLELLYLFLIIFMAVIGALIYWQDSHSSHSH
jgi:hypothetical protein